jgi:lysophospholipase L1-like esterase
MKLKFLLQNKIIKTFIYTAYLVFAVLILLEIFLRIFDPFDITHYFELMSCLNRMKHNDRYEYTQQPGFDHKYRNFTLKINSEGFRGPEFQIAKPQGVKRLLLIGDSMVLGWGVPLDSIFPTLLQNSLDQAGLNYQVIPAGVISWNTRTEFEFLRTRGIDYQPDAVCVVVFANDVIPKLRSYTEVAKDKLFPNLDSMLNRPLWREWVSKIGRTVVYNSYALTTIMYLAVWRTENDNFNEYYAKDSPAWLDTKLALQEMVNFCHKRGIKLIVILGTYQNKNAPSAQIYRQRYGRYLEKLGVPYHAVVIAFSDPKLRNSVTDGHPSIAGHKIIAGELKRILVPILSDKREGESSDSQKDVAVKTEPIQ